MVCQQSNIIRVVTKLTSQPWSEIPGDHYEDKNCEIHSQDGINIRHCVGEQTEFIEYLESIESPTEPFYDSALTVGRSAASGFAYAFVPEAIGDGLQQAGLVSETTAGYIKTGVNAALILATGSYLATGASVATNAFCKHVLGCSDENAAIVSHGVTIAVNAAKDATPLGIATTVASAAVGYVASKFGFWAEKKVMQNFTGKTNLFTKVATTNDPHISPRAAV